MIYDLQVLFDKGFTTLAYQIEAMMEKAPHIEDDFYNLIEEVSEILQGADEAISAAYEEGKEEFAETLSYECDVAMDNTYQEGYENGFDEGYDKGLEQGKGEIN